MVTVYVERGATFVELKDLSRKGRLTLIHFPYDEGDRSFFYGKWSKYLRRAKGSLVTCDTTQLTADAAIRISDMERSAIYSKIQQIVGRASEHDVRHLDAAYKSKADAFLTQDKRDIVRNRTELEQSTGLRIFHSDDDRDKFLEFIERHAPGERSLGEGRSDGSAAECR
jgi:hypothetical protein